MKRLASQGLLVALTALMLGVYVQTLGMPEQEGIMSGFAVLLILLSLLLERVFPFEVDWNKSRGDLGGDVTMAVLLFGILEGLLKGATPFVLLMLLGDIASAGLAVPLWLEIAIVGLLIEFGAYVSHRLHHRTAALWALHAMHHSPERLYTLNNFRFHPLNHILNHLFMIVPPLLLGFSPQSILGYTALTLPILLLQHSNVDFHFGWFNLVLNTNEVHRWHHSTAECEGHSNLGRATVIWDQLLGTYYTSDESHAPQEIGLFPGSRSFPAARQLLAQLAYPFSPECCRRPNEA